MGGSHCEPDQTDDKGEDAQLISGDAWVLMAAQMGIIITAAVRTGVNQTARHVGRVQVGLHVDPHCMGSSVLG